MTDPTPFTDILDRHGLAVAMLALCIWAIVALYKRGLEKDREVLALASAVTTMNTSFTTWDQIRREREQHEREALYAKIDGLGKQIEDLSRTVGARHGSP